MDIIAIIGVLGGLTGLASLLGIIATWRKAQAEGRKADAEGTSAIVLATSELLDDMREELRYLRGRVSEQEQKIQALRGAQNCIQEVLDRALLRVDALETEREQLRQRIRVLEGELHQVREENAALRCDNIALVRQITMTNEEVDDDR